MSTPVEVTTLWCPSSGVEEGEDSGTHHLVPRTRNGDRVEVCRYCLRTEADLRAEAIAQRRLRRTSLESLLRSAYALTHQMHGLPMGQSASRVTFQRSRDAIDAEVRRRIAVLEDALRDVVGDHCDSHAERLRTCPTCSALTVLDLLRDAEG